jgi:hypothetical protein
MFYHPTAVFRKAMSQSSFAKMITNAVKIYFKAQGATLIVTHFPGPFLKQIAMFRFILIYERRLNHSANFAEVRWAGVPSRLCCPAHY